MSDPAHPPAHPAQRPQTITCGPENVREFNAQLRQHAPQAFDLAKVLHAAGLLDGLRGARLATGGARLARGNAISLDRVEVGDFNEKRKG